MRRVFGFKHQKIEKVYIRDIRLYKVKMGSKSNKIAAWKSYIT